jgi:hypothetical protein
MIELTTDGVPQQSAETLLAGFLTPEQAAAELRVCKRTLERWRVLKEGPPITKLGRRALYRRSSIQKWLADREHACDLPHAKVAKLRSPATSNNGAAHDSNTKVVRRFGRRNDRTS